MEGTKTKIHLNRVINLWTVTVHKNLIMDESKIIIFNLE